MNYKGAAVNLFGRFISGAYQLSPFADSPKNQGRSPLSVLSAAPFFYKE
jgi:hypothetical protein